MAKKSTKKVGGSGKPDASKVRVRRWRVKDIPRLLEVQNAAYGNSPPHELCDERHFRLQLKTFPEGQLLAEVDGEVVGFTATLIVSLDRDDIAYSYAEITGDGTFTTHNPGGDTLYGAEMAVHPDFQGRGIAKRLYKERMKLLTKLNLRRMVAGGRIPGYMNYAGRMSAEQYVKKVVAGEITDPTLTPQVRSGYRVRGVQMDYLQDAESLNYATLLEYINEDFDSQRRQISAAVVRRPVRQVRVCAVQYEMRSLPDFDAFERQIDFFIATADEYHCHFLVFPELFTIQLISTMDPKTEPTEAIKRVADMREWYVELFKKRAMDTGMYIIAGSTPMHSDHGLVNTAHLFTPSGQVHLQDKLHVTPAERDEYGLVPGQGMKVFDTPLGKIAIQICYDVEFPEMTRLMTLAGAEILFVPFSTDDRRAYGRVRYCGQARAVENWLYVVMAGNVGNLPSVRSFLINYGQSAILTPSDFGYPSNGVLAEADSNTETVSIADLDLSSLSRQRNVGSVRPLHDRRPDLYNVAATPAVEMVRVW